MDTVGGRKRALLKYYRRSTSNGTSDRIAEFVPTDRCNSVALVCAYGYGVVYYQRLMIRNIAIRQPIHQSVSQRIEFLVCITLRDARSSPIPSRDQYCDWRVGSS